MGNSELRESSNGPGHNKLMICQKITREQEESMRELIMQRSAFNNEHLCSVEKYELTNDDSNNMFCEQFHEIKISYGHFDSYLDDWKKNYPLHELQVEKIIYAVCLALNYLLQHQTHHGDINPKTICGAGDRWKLLDSFFIRRGITAYERVLQGEEGFISPKQMEKIRYGFVRESPPIQESDDIFALGMTCLEIMSGKISRLCYKESYLRFNQKQIQNVCHLIQQRYSSGLCEVVFSMLAFKEQERTNIKGILSYPLIARHSNKLSLRPFQNHK